MSHVLWNKCILNKVHEHEQLSFRMGWHTFLRPHNRNILIRIFRRWINRFNSNRTILSGRGMLIAKYFVLNFFVGNIFADFQCFVLDWNFGRTRFESKYYRSIRYHFGLLYSYRKKFKWDFFGIFVILLFFLWQLCFFMVKCCDMRLMEPSSSNFDEIRMENVKMCNSKI